MFTWAGVWLSRWGLQVALKGEVRPAGGAQGPGEDQPVLRQGRPPAALSGPRPLPVLGLPFTRDAPHPAAGFHRR